jgi:hypothetical protein
MRQTLLDMVERVRAKKRPDSDPQAKHGGRRAESRFSSHRLVTAEVYQVKCCPSTLEKVTTGSGRDMVTHPEGRFKVFLEELIDEDGEYHGDLW